MNVALPFDPVRAFHDAVFSRFGELGYADVTECVRRRRRRHQLVRFPSSGSGKRADCQSPALYADTGANPNTCANASPVANTDADARSQPNADADPGPEFDGHRSFGIGDASAREADHACDHAAGTFG